MEEDTVLPWRMLLAGGLLAGGLLAGGGSACPFRILLSLDMDCLRVKYFACRRALLRMAPCFLMP